MREIFTKFAGMKLKEFYNPRHVYDGWFETYFIRPYFHHYADFRGRESGRSCVMSLLSWLVVTLGLSGILMGLVGLLGPEVGYSALAVVGCLWGAVSLVPLASMLARSFNGSPERDPRPRLLGVDTLLGVSSLLFFVFGLLMMETTMNSGSLNPNAGMTDEEDTVVAEMEEVTEEPIFTYQDDVEADTAMAAVDTLSDMTEPDLVEADESFDPTLKTPEEEVAPAEDSL